MSQAAAAIDEARVGRISAFTAAVVLVAGFTLLRLGVLFTTPLELYPDEAQYWAWAQAPALGYVSKPPLVAWLIWLTTSIGGNAEPWVRLSAPLVHAGAALALQRAGQRLYDGRTGFWAAALYMLMPGVQLSAGVITTDAPLFLCLALALWAYTAMLDSPDRPARLAAAAGLGAAIGLAALSKYAAAYFVIGLLVHMALSRRTRSVWGRQEMLAVAGVALVVLAPNLIWNLSHSFATLDHTVQNAGWGPAVPQPLGRLDGPDVYDFRDAPGFLLTQLGVFGPIPFVVLLVGGIELARRRTLEASDRLLLCFVLPPLLIVLVQAAISRANANWGAAAYGAASLLVAAWLVRWKAGRLIAATVMIQGAIAAVFLAAAASPRVADGLGLGNSFKRARGWNEATQAIIARANSGAGAERFDAIAVDDRFLFNAAAYYGRDYLSRPGAPKLVMWLRRPQAYTQAEAAAPLSAASGRTILGASLESVYLREMQGDFAHVTPLGSATIPLDDQRNRGLSFFRGEDFRLGPRDPATGLPIHSATQPAG